MNKSLRIILIILILLTLAIVVTLLNNRAQPEGSIGSVDVYSDLTVAVPNNSGDKIRTDNFLVDPSVVVDEQNPGTYFLGNTFNTTGINENDPAYVIVFENGGGYFNVALLKQPFSASRREAEAYLVQLLNIRENELCELNYTVTVPGYVSEEASGIDYRFSVCSDAQPL